MRLWRIAASLALLALLGFAIDVPAALARLGDAEPGWVLGALLLVQAQVVLSASRWRLTAERLGQRIAARRAIAEYYLATLLNQVLPGGVAGDAARAVRGAVGGGVSRREDEARTAPAGSLARSAQGVVIERLAGQISLVAVALGGLLAWPFLLDSPPPRAGLLALGGALGLLAGAALLIPTLARAGPRRWRHAARRVAPALRRCWLDDGAWLVQGTLSLAVTASYVGVFALAGLALGAPLSPAVLASVVPLTLASMLVPLSIGGWGLREAAAAALWPLAGSTAEIGVATSVLYGLLSLAGSLPGLLVLIRTPGAGEPRVRRGGGTERAASEPLQVSSPGGARAACATRCRAP